MSFSVSGSVGSRSPLRLRSHSHLFTSNIQMNRRRPLSCHYLQYDDLNMRGDRLISIATCLIDVKEPKSVSDVLTNQEWVDAMKAEIDSLHNNSVWELVQLPEG